MSGSGAGVFFGEPFRLFGLHGLHSPRSSAINPASGIAAAPAASGKRSRPGYTTQLASGFRSANA